MSYSICYDTVHHVMINSNLVKFARSNIQNLIQNLIILHYVMLHVKIQHYIMVRKRACYDTAYYNIVWYDTTCYVTAYFDTCSMWRSSMFAD